MKQFDHFTQDHTDIHKIVCDIISFKGGFNSAKFQFREIEAALWETARINQVETIVGHYLLEALPEAEVPSRWAESHRLNLAKISAYVKELDRVAQIFAAEGIPLVALKNGGIASGIYPCPGCVPMGDVDTLVRRSDFVRAHHLLIENGYTIAAPNKLEKADVNYGYLKGGSEYKTTLPDGQSLWFELQWRPVDGKFIRPDQEPSADELVERSISIEGSAVRLLSPEDNLLQVCLHTAKHSFIRAPGFRLHLDVDRIVGYQHIDWELFVNKVVGSETRVPVYFSLLIPHRIFGTKIPQEVLNKIKPVCWRRKAIGNWISRAGLFDPDEAKFSKAGYIVFTALLYDSVFGLLKGIFPPVSWMKEKYDFKNELYLPYFYLKRIMDLTFRRMPT